MRLNEGLVVDNISWSQYTFLGAGAIYASCAWGYVMSYKGVRSLL